MDLDKESIEALNGVLRNIPPLPDEDLAGAAQTKKHSKQKKKDSSFLYGNEMAEILKSNVTPEQKLKAVCEKYSETLHANRKLMMANKMAEGRIVKLQQENEQCQQQRSKAVLTRSRLENLCRELQKLNKAQKEEIDLKLRLEEEKRKEISATFQSAFAEMNTLTNQNTEKNTKMREENLEMREKIKSVRERVELSEQQLEQVRQQAQLELQLAEAKIATVKMEMTAEKECLLKEKQQLLLKLTEYQVRISELQATEVGLRSQISMYTEKYDDFQNALTKSNELFSGFNEEMEKMSKKIVKLEKETSLWKQRWEKSHAALLEMAADKQARDAEMGKLTQKLSLLQELCKVFQRERAELLAQLRALNGNTSTTNTTNVENSKIDNVDIKQVEELSADCQQLKDDLAHLQDAIPPPIKEDKTEESVAISSAEQTNDSTQSEKIKNESSIIESESEVNKNQPVVTEDQSEKNKNKSEIDKNEPTITENDSETKKIESEINANGPSTTNDKAKMEKDDFEIVKNEFAMIGNESQVIQNKSENQPNACIIIKSIVQLHDKNKTAKDEVNVKLIKKNKKDDNLNDEILKLNDETKHIVLIPETLVEENKSNDTNTILSNDSSVNLPMNKDESIIDATQCKRDNESCLIESINDESENLLATLGLVEVKVEECSPDVTVEEGNAMNKINLPTTGLTNDPVVNKNSNACAVSEGKKEGIIKQNNSNPTKKGSGKRKKK